MADIKPISVPSKRLSETINGSATSFKVDDILGWDGVALTSSDLGTVAYAVFRNSAGTLMEIMEIDPTTIASTSITINKRGLKFTGDLTTEVSANKLTWVKGDTIVELGTHFPQLLKHMVDTIADQTVGGVKTFSSLPATSAGDPVANNDLARKAYVDAVALGTLTTINVIVPATAGETVAAGNLVYFDTTDNEWKLCDADTASTVDNVMLGIAQGAGTDGNAITGGVLLQGVDGNQSGMTEGDVMYASNTAGGISSSAGTTEVAVGIAKSATDLYFKPRFNQIITEDQQAALAGTSGTPSGSNQYVTADDVSDAAASGKIVRTIGTSLPALSGENLTNVAAKSFHGWFGDGLDGDATFSDQGTAPTGTTKTDNTAGATIFRLDRDVFYDTTTIDATVTINTNGYRLFSQTLLTNNGTIQSNGGAGGDGSYEGAGGTAGAATGAGTLSAGTPGEIGGTTVGGNGVNGDSVNPSLGSNGSAGGAGGAGGTSGAGTAGTAGTATSENAFPKVESTFDALTAGSETTTRILAVVKGATSGENLSPSAGGGSGSAGGGDAGSNNWGSGGGSGASGGIVFVSALTLDNTNGTIQANGGAGGDGGAGAGAGGSGGGGAGGAGGVACLIYRTLTAIGTVQANGGAGGAGGVGGNQNGSAGTAGGTGKVYRWKII